MDPSQIPLENQTPQAGEGLPHYYSQDQANAIAQNNPYSSTYNPGWRNHPNFSWSNPNNSANPSHVQPFIPNPNYQGPPPNSQTSQATPQSKQPYRHPNFQTSTQSSKSSQPS